MRRILSLAVACLSCCLLPSCASDLVVLGPGDTAPPFRLDDLEGRALTLSEHRGRYVMVRFWADWCKSCRVEMPLIERMYREHRSQGLTVLALNVRQSHDVAGKFARDLGLTYPVLLDRDGASAEAYGVLGLPTTFLIDGEGRILEEVIGDMNERSLTALLAPLFAETAGAGPRSAR